MFYSKLIFYGEGQLASCPNATWITTPCRPSTAAYSIYLQLLSIAGGRLLYPQPEDVPCQGESQRLVVNKQRSQISYGEVQSQEAKQSRG
jgi:hypothetical protein